MKSSENVIHYACHDLFFVIARHPDESEVQTKHLKAKGHDPKLHADAPW